MVCPCTLMRELHAEKLGVNTSTVPMYNAECVGSHERGKALGKLYLSLPCCNFLLTIKVSSSPPQSLVWYVNTADVPQIF
jgi:hypothetical protein